MMTKGNQSGLNQTISLMVILVVALGVVATLVGLFWGGGEGSYPITTYRGQDVEIYGEGIYKDNTVFGAGSARGTDLVTLVLVIPILIVGLILHRGGSIRGTLILAGGLLWMAYVYVSVALGTTAYNELFLLYVSLLGLSAWSLVLLLSNVNLPAFGTSLGPDVPTRSIATFLIAGCVITVLIWLIEPVEALIQGDYPQILGISTTLFTHGFDIAFISPAAILSGMLILRSRPLGYLVGLPMMMLIALLAPAIAAQTAFQMAYGESFNAIQLTFMIGGFAIMGVIAIWLVAKVLRHLR